MPPKVNPLARQMSELKERDAREMREMKEMLDALETSQTRGMVTGYLSDKEEGEEESSQGGSKVEMDPDDLRMEKLLKEVKGEGSKIKIDLPVYGGKLDSEEILDWIGALDNYFEYEYVPEEKRVNFSKKKLKGHALLWWDYVQDERRKKGKSKITSWDRMVTKLKCKFLHSDYNIQLFRRLQNLKQKDMEVQAYTEEFYKLSIREGHIEDDVEKVERYINGLRYNLQDELSLTNPRMMEECYKLAIKAEDKLRRWQEKQSRGRDRNYRGRGKFAGRGKSQRSQGKSSNNQEQSSNSMGRFRGRRPNNRGRFGGQRGGSSGCWKSKDRQLRGGG